MHDRRKERARGLASALLSLFVATAATAGTNAGFTVSLSGPTEVRDASVGQSVTVRIMVANVTEAKQASVSAAYDSAVVGNVDLQPGAFIPQPFIVPGILTVLRPDGLMQLTSAGAQFKAPRAGAGSGVLYTLSFRVRGEVPEGGTSVSVTRVMIAKDSADKDSLTYDPGELGVALTRTVIRNLSGFVLVGEEPVPGARVSATLADSATTARPYTALADADGVYSMDLPGGTYLLEADPPADRDDLRATRLLDPVALNEDTQLDLALRPRTTNVLSDLSIIRSDDGALISWESTWAGIDDVVRYRQMGANTWLEAHPVRDARLTAQVLADLRALRTANLLPETASVAEILRVLHRTLTVAQIRALAEAAPLLLLAGRHHVVPLTHLTAATQYEFNAVSTSISGPVSAPLYGTFRTRREPDVRPLAILRLDVQPQPQSAIISWQTNRPADARYTVRDSAGAVVASGVMDTSGTPLHIVKVDSLARGHAYAYAVESMLRGVHDLVSRGLMAAADTAASRSGTFRTQASEAALHLVNLPFATVGTQSATVFMGFNQPASVDCQYGEVGNLTAKITQDSPADSTGLYTWSVVVNEYLPFHAITLSDLEPRTDYRFRIVGTAPGGQQVDTDPHGNEQWSMDLRFTTSAAGDTLPPVIIAGPVVRPSGQYAVVTWVTDVIADGKVVYGSLGVGGTLGTSDEFEVRDVLPNGQPRMDLSHIVVLKGLIAGTEYGFRIESRTANGLSVVYDPFGSLSGGAAKLLQPPGGAGSFTTSLTADTQYPVILTGPTVTSRTHNTAVIEWTTDESADSQVRFGTTGLSNQYNAADAESRHKMVLTNLSPGASYLYRIGSTDPAGNGATESSQASFTTNPDLDLTAPRITQAPTVIYKNDRSATVRWVTDEDASSQVDFGRTQSLGFVRTASATAETHELTLTGLQPNTQYYYRASSTDLSNNGPTTSSILSFTTDATADLTSPVITSTSITATPADSSAIIAWTTNEVANSYVEFDVDSLSLDRSVGDEQTVTSHEIVLTNLMPATRYHYRVGSVDRAGNPPSESTVRSFTTLAGADNTPPAVPTSLAADSSNAQVHLAWQAQLEFDLNGFNVYRKAAGAATFTKVATGVRDAEYTDLSVTNGVTYTYYVTAIDRRNPPNESAPSSTVHATPIASQAPSMPANLTVQKTETTYLRPTFVFTNSIKVYSASTLTYTVQVSTQSTFGNVTASISGLAQALTPTTGWTITRTLTEDQTYYWRVRAVETRTNGSQINGPYSAAQSYVARPPAALPGDFNEDNTVGLDDFFLFVDAFNQAATGAFAIFDLAPDGYIDITDFFVFVDHFGQTAAGKLWAVATAVDQRASLSLLATGGTVSDGRRVTVQVRGEDLEAVRAFGAVVQYDAETLEFEAATPGSASLLTGPDGRAPLYRVMAQAPGELVIGSGITHGEPVSGAGVLAELTFRLVGPASSARFDLTEGAISGPAGIRRVGHLFAGALVPRQFHLGANYPNPFNPSTSIEYGLPEAGPVQVAIYDALGQHVRTLVQEAHHAAGYFTATWDGRDAAGRAVGSGVYFYRLQTPQFTRTQRMALVK